jgi:cardiolipin synthase
VGSSNLDPLSLSLNLESNVIVRDKAFNGVLWERMDHLMRNACKLVEAADLASEWSGWRLVRSFFVFHILRWYPALLGRLPRHVPRLTPAEATDLADRRDTGLSQPAGGATQTEAA